MWSLRQVLVFMVLVDCTQINNIHDFINAAVLIIIMGIEVYCMLSLAFVTQRYGAGGRCLALDTTVMCS